METGEQMDIGPEGREISTRPVTCARHLCPAIRVKPSVPRAAATQ